MSIKGHLGTGWNWAGKDLDTEVWPYHMLDRACLSCANNNNVDKRAFGNWVGSYNVAFGTGSVLLRAQIEIRSDR